MPLVLPFHFSSQSKSFQKQYTITPNILARYMMTCILTILCRQHTASHQYHQSCYHSNDSQSSKNTNKGGLGASLPPSHKTEAELTCPLNT